MNGYLSRFISFELVLGLLLSTPSVAYSQSPVKWSQASKARSATGGALYIVNYAYDFKGHDSIYLKDFGLVPPKGQFAYLTDDPTIIMHDSAYNKVLYRTTPQVSTVADSIELPDESDFATAGREERWSSPKPFLTAIAAVLNKMGCWYFPYERSPLYYLRSTYVSLEPLPKNLRSEVALLVSHPYTPKGKEFGFRTQIALRERPVKQEKWTNQVSEDTRRAADQWIEKLMNRLLQEGKGVK